MEKAMVVKEVMVELGMEVTQLLLEDMVLLTVPAEERSSMETRKRRMEGKMVEMVEMEMVVGVIVTEPLPLAMVSPLQPMELHLMVENDEMQSNVH